MLQVCEVTVLAKSPPSLSLSSLSPSLLPFLSPPSLTNSLPSFVDCRVHRLGQTRPVEVYRFICTDTVEERLIALQVTPISITSFLSYQLLIDSLLSIFDLLIIDANSLQFIVDASQMTFACILSPLYWFCTRSLLPFCLPGHEEAVVSRRYRRCGRSEGQGGEAQHGRVARPVLVIYRIQLDRIGLNWVELNWIELDWVELSWVELSWADLNWIGSECVSAFKCTYARLFSI